SFKKQVDSSYRKGVYIWALASTYERLHSNNHIKKRLSMERMYLHMANCMTPFVTFKRICTHVKMEKSDKKRSEERRVGKEERERQQREKETTATGGKRAERGKR